MAAILTPKQMTVDEISDIVASLNYASRCD